MPLSTVAPNISVVRAGLLLGTGEPSPQGWGQVTSHLWGDHPYAWLAMSLSPASLGCHEALQLPLVIFYNKKYFS